MAEPAQALAGKGRDQQDEPEAALDPCQQRRVVEIVDVRPTGGHRGGGEPCRRRQQADPPDRRNGARLLRHQAGRAIHRDLQLIDDPSGEHVEGELLRQCLAVGVGAEHIDQLQVLDLLSDLMLQRRAGRMMVIGQLAEQVRQCFLRDRGLVGVLVELGDGGRIFGHDLVRLDDRLHRGL